MTKGLKRIEVAPGSFDNLRRGDQKGDPERRRTLMSAWRMSVEEELEVSGHSHSGKLLLLNPRTGIKFTIDTGEADSEIVYADEHTVIYRTNDVLFQSDLVGNKLIPAKRIVAGPHVVGVHWMFIGPDVK